MKLFVLVINLEKSNRKGEQYEKKVNQIVQSYSLFGFLIFKYFK